MLRRIGAEEGGEFKAVASGTLSSGKPVVVNADGTVSVVSSSTASVGSATVFESASTGVTASTFDSSNNRIVISYRDSGNSNYATVVVGTVSGSSISFGTPTVIRSAAVNNEALITFDSNSNKVIAGYSHNALGKCKVLTVDPSDNSISVGSETTFDTQQGTYLDMTFDSTNNKVVVVYTGQNNYVETKVGTVSGTSISFGTAVVAMSLSSDQNTITFDSNRGKVVVCSRVSIKGRAAVGTVSGTSISFASNVIFADNQTKYIAPTFDTANNKVVIAFINGSSTDQGQVVVGDINSSGVISFGSAVTYNAEIEEFQGIAFDSNANKVVIAYDSKPTSKGQVISGTVSGTSITFDSETVFEAASVEGVSVAFDSNANKNVISYIDAGNSNYGTSVVFTPGSTTLTSENYIGMSRGVAFQSPIAEGVGSAVQYKAASFAYGPLVFDSNANKTVFAYPDAGDSNKGKAKVATVSGTSISFGSEATFTTNHCDQLESVFDSSNNKVVIVYRDQDNSSYGTAVVGTVSGTSITFGSPVVFNSANCFWFGIAFDSTNNKVVIAYRDQGNSGYGTAIVGTVSGTSISFGSETTFESAVSVRNQLVYDTTNQKIVLAYINGSTSGPLQSRVGTVSGTSISFGSEVTIDSDTCFEPQLVFNPDTGTVIVIYYNSTDGNGTSKIGTVSGTSISFSSETVFNSGGTSDMDIVYDSNAQKVVVTYKKSDADGFLKVGTVGASSISYGTELEFADYDISYTNSAFDSNLNKVVIGYADLSNSNYGTAIVFQNTGTETIRGQVADGGNALVDVIGSVSDNQIGLTAGQQYFVQTDGTISTTADDPSVLAGTAISATELVVKT